jgi:hypothetical protein
MKKVLLTIGLIGLGLVTNASAAVTMPTPDYTDIQRGGCRRFRDRYLPLLS